MKLKRITKYIITVVLAAAVTLCACERTAPRKETETVSEATYAATVTAAEDTSAAETIPPAQTPGMQSTTGSGETERVTESTAEEKTPFSTDMVITNLNIKHGAEGLDKVASAIREVSPDIMGLEEVDVNCSRSGCVDEPAELSRLTGLPYHAFSKAISLGNGEYGTAILSRYPIVSYETVKFDSGRNEGRSVGHAVINVEGLLFDVFVTHLSFEDRDVRKDQMKTIAAILAQCERYVLTGDLNCFDLEDISYLGAAYCVNRPDRRYGTFYRYSSFFPDNIAVSGEFTELSSGMSDTECSDHRLLYAKFRFTER